MICNSPLQPPPVRGRLRAPFYGVLKLTAVSNNFHLSCSLDAIPERYT